MRRAARLLRVSSLYETEPLVPAAPGESAHATARVGRRAGWYLNQVAEVQTDLAPEALLREAQRVEERLGRERSPERWAPRVIDIDVLLYGDIEWETERLVVPHPALTRRRFVLVPLAELSPDLRVPGTGRTVAEHLSALSDPLRVIPYGDT